MITATSRRRLTALKNEYMELHNLAVEFLGGGCKSTCGIVEFQIRFNEYNRPTYSLWFGGYCFGGMTRTERTITSENFNVVLDDFERLLKEIKETKYMTSCLTNPTPSDTLD
jgi:hypothetical protein